MCSSLDRVLKKQLVFSSDPDEGSLPPVELHPGDCPLGPQQLVFLPSEPAGRTGQKTLVPHHIPPPHLRCELEGFLELQPRGAVVCRPAQCPNNLPCCSIQPSLWYHSSAVLALALDALTVPYRMRNNSIPMWQVAETLAVSGRKVVPRCHLCHYEVKKGPCCRGNHRCLCCRWWLLTERSPFP